MSGTSGVDAGSAGGTGGVAAGSASDGAMDDLVDVPELLALHYLTSMLCKEENAGKSIIDTTANFVGYERHGVRGFYDVKLEENDDDEEEELGVRGFYDVKLEENDDEEELEDEGMSDSYKTLYRDEVTGRYIVDADAVSRIIDG